MTSILSQPEWWNIEIRIQTKHWKFMGKLLDPLDPTQKSKLWLKPSSLVFITLMCFAWFKVITQFRIKAPYTYISDPMNPTQTGWFFYQRNKFTI